MNRFPFANASIPCCHLTSSSSFVPPCTWCASSFTSIRSGKSFRKSSLPPRRNEASSDSRALPAAIPGFAGRSSSRIPLPSSVQTDGDSAPESSEGEPSSSPRNVCQFMTANVPSPVTLRPKSSLRTSEFWRKAYSASRYCGGTKSDSQLLMSLVVKSRISPPSIRLPQKASSSRS